MVGGWLVNPDSMGNLHIFLSSYLTLVLALMFLASSHYDKSIASISSSYGVLLSIICRNQVISYRHYLLSIRSLPDGPNSSCKKQFLNVMDADNYLEILKLLLMNYLSFNPHLVIYRPCRGVQLFPQL